MPNELEQLKKRVEDLEREVKFYVRADRYRFLRDVEIGDTFNLRFSGNTGTKVGTSSSEKLALWGVTPVDQPAAVSDASFSTITSNAETTNNTTINSNFTSLRDTINTILDRLQEAGIIRT